MLDLLFEPARMFIEGGIEKFRHSRELKNLTIAVHDRLRREIQFNLAILDEAFKEDDAGPVNGDETVSALVQSLKTAAFDSINDGPIPVGLLIAGEIDRNDWPKSKKRDTYDEYLKNIHTVVELLDRAYYRLHIAKTLAACHKLTFDPGYIRFMLVYLHKVLKSAEKETG